MRTPWGNLFAVTIVCIMICYALVADDREHQSTSAPAKMQLAEYDEDGGLLRPSGYEKWVLAGTSIGLGYSDTDKTDRDHPGMFHNVYIQPEAFDHFVSTGEFREQTVFVMTNNRSQPAQTIGPVSRSGFVAGPTSGLEVAVKDSQRFPDGWAYFMFGDQRETDPRTSAKAFARKDCFDCHAEHGAIDNVFTQFYSVLTEAREKHLSRTATK